LQLSLAYKEGNQMADLTLPLDRDSYIAAILASGTSGHLSTPEAVVKRYFEILTEIQKHKGTWELYAKADKAARSG